MTDKCQTWAPTARNTGPILEVLKRVLPRTGTVLEIASGTGQHAAHFAPVLPDIVWQPCEANPDHHESIRAWVGVAEAGNLRQPLLLDVCDAVWPVETDPPDPPVSALVNTNMIHIAPWAACLALFAGAARILPREGVLFLYGPYIVGGEYCSEGDRAFDADLRRRNPEWGLRNLEELVAVAEGHGFAMHETVEMPANNLSLVFRRENALETMRS